MHIGQMIGGLDVYIRNSITYSSGRNEYIIVHGKYDGCYPVVCQGKEVKFYPISLQRKLSLREDAIAIRDAIRLIRELKPDVIHCHSAKGGVIGRIAGFVTGTPTLYTAHAFSFLSSGNKMVRFVYKLVERMTKFHAYLLACSDSEMKLGRSIAKYRKTHALVWRNAVPEPILDISKVSLNIPNHPYLCYIGRPSYQKNPLFLVNMIAQVHQQHPEVRFYLLGVGYHSPDLEAMQREIRNKHLESYCFLMPWVNHNDAMAFLKHALFYVTVARYEGLPLSVIEAMAMGKCIVASKVVGNEDCVWDNVNGKLLKLDAKLFAKVICGLIENPEEVERMGLESRRLFEEEFRIENRIALLENIYEQIAHRRK